MRGALDEKRRYRCEHRGDHDPALEAFVKAFSPHNSEEGHPKWEVAPVHFSPLLQTRGVVATRAVVLWRRETRRSICRRPLSLPAARVYLQTGWERPQSQLHPLY